MAKQMDEDFNAAFAEGEPPETGADTAAEDAAFGIVPPAAEEVPAGDSDASVSGDAAAVTSLEDAFNEEDVPADAPAEAPAAAAEDAPVDPVAADPAVGEADAQRERSWEGRLKAREAELAKRAAELDAREAALSAPAAAADDGQAALVIDVAPAEGDVPENVAAAIAQMTEDFGPEFVDAIKAMAMHFGGRAAGDSVGAVSKNIDDVVAAIKDASIRDHFERILDRHEDFFDAYQSPEFGAWRDALPEDEKADALRIEQNGSAREVIKLLDRFKAGRDAGTDKVNSEAAAAEAAAEVDPWADEAVADAEGVRNSGLRLPPEVNPTNNDDYLDAWNKA